MLLSHVIAFRLTPISRSASHAKTRRRRTCCGSARLVTILDYIPALYNASTGRKTYHVCASHGLLREQTHQTKQATEATDKVKAQVLCNEHLRHLHEGIDLRVWHDILAGLSFHQSVQLLSNTPSKDPLSESNNLQSSSDKQGGKRVVERSMTSHDLRTAWSIADRWSNSTSSAMTLGTHCDCRNAGRGGARR